jgi:hypothetical protein
MSGIAQNVNVTLINCAEFQYLWVKTRRYRLPYVATLGVFDACSLNEAGNPTTDRSALMKTQVIAVAGVAAATLVMGVTVTGCGSKSDKATTTSSSGSTSSTSAATSSPSSSAQAAPADYTNLLIQASDIALPGDTFTAAPPTQNPNGKAGVATVFSNQGDTREIGDTILILPDPAGAATALDGAKSSLGSSVTGGEPQPAEVGAGGTIVSGTSPDGSKSVTVVLFTEGKAFVTLEFDGKPDDPVPPDFATGIGQKQDAAIKSGLPS